MTKIYYRKEDRITGKIILLAELKNETPLIIGSGQSNDSDLDMLKYPDSTPYIPGSSLAGKIQRQFEDRQSTFNKGSAVFTRLWGTSGDVLNQTKTKDSFQSHIIIEDAVFTGTDHTFKVKDGIKINPTTNIVKEGGKYDYEVLEPGATFQFRAEITLRGETTLRAGFDQPDFQQCADFVLQILENDFRMGAKTMAGFGKMECDKPTMHVYDFSVPDHRTTWFKYLKDPASNIAASTIATKIPFEKEHDFSIKADFSIKSALMTSEAGIGVKEPDKVQSKRGNDFYVSGKSIRGAIRHRASKILNTLISPADAKKQLDILFGQVEEEHGGHVSKSKVRIEESILENVHTKPQTRIKIDRFTGGTIDSALMETSPAWATKKDNLTIRMSMKKEKDNDVTLLLMVLKDLWTEDLPIGGEKSIGRGILIGEKAVIKIGDKKAEITRNENSIDVSNIEVLQPFNHFEFKKTPTNETGN